MSIQIITFIIGTIGSVFLFFIGIISYFLNRTMRELDNVKETAENNTIKISLLENNHTHLTDRFDLLYDAVKDLTTEIKNLNIQLSKKKDI